MPYQISAMIKKSWGILSTLNQTLD